MQARVCAHAAATWNHHARAANERRPRGQPEATLEHHMVRYSAYFTFDSVCVRLPALGVPGIAVGDSLLLMWLRCDALVSFHVPVALGAVAWQSKLCFSTALMFWATAHR